MSIIDFLTKVSRLKIRFSVPSVRQIQIEAIEYAMSVDKCNIQMPTGSGKSLVIRGLSYYFVDSNYVVFIIVPSYDIGDKILGEIVHESMRLNPKFHTPQRDCLLDSSSKIIITTYQTFWRRLESYKSLFKNKKIVVIYDESHHVNILAPRNFQAASSFEKIYSISASPWSPFCIALTKNRFCYKITSAIKDQVISKPNIICDIPDPSDCTLQPEIWYYPSISDALASLGKEYRNGKLYQIGENQHKNSYAGFTCSIIEASTPDLVKQFNRGLIKRAIVVDKLKEGFDSNIMVKGQKIPVKRVVILSHESSPISLYQRAGRALRPGAGTIHCLPSQKRILYQAFALADGEPIVCEKCGEEHLSVHHNALQSKLTEDSLEDFEVE